MTTNEFSINEDAINRVEECCAELTTMVIELPHIHVITSSNFTADDKFIGDLMETTIKYGVEASHHVVSPADIMVRVTELSENLNNKIIFRIHEDDIIDYPRLTEIMDIIKPMSDVEGYKVPLIDLVSIYDSNDLVTHPTFNPVAKSVLLVHMLNDEEIKGKNVAIINDDTFISSMYNRLGATTYCINSGTSDMTKTNILINSDVIVNCGTVAHMPSKLVINTLDEIIKRLSILFILYNSLATQMTNEVVMYNDNLKRSAESEHI